MAATDVDVHGVTVPDSPLGSMAASDDAGAAEATNVTQATAPGGAEPAEEVNAAADASADKVKQLTEQLATLQAAMDKAMAMIESLSSKETKREAERHVGAPTTSPGEAKLKPIDIKDIEKPDKYDGNPSKFLVWWGKFQDLLANRHPSWKGVLAKIEKRDKDSIPDTEEEVTKFFKSIGNEVAEQKEEYQQQLKSYLRTYTSGDLHARITHTQSKGCVEFLREMVCRGKDHNDNRLLDLKQLILSPAKATKVENLDKVLTEWKYNMEQVLEREPESGLSNENKKTILMRIMPPEYKVEMRKVFHDTDKKDYYAFEQALHDEISTRKMDDETRKNRASIGAVGEECQGHDNCQETEYEYVLAWSEDDQKYVNALIPAQGKRDRDTVPSEDDERPIKQQKGFDRDSKGKGKGGKGGKRPVGPCWTCGGPHFQRDCPQSSSGNQNFPTTSAWSAWRPATYPGPTPTQWNSWMPKKGKGKGGKGGKSAGKGSKGKGKGPIGDMSYAVNYAWGQPLGQVQQDWSEDYNFDSMLSICAVTQYSGSETMRKPEQAIWQTASGKKSARCVLNPVTESQPKSEEFSNKFGCLIQEHEDEAVGDEEEEPDLRPPAAKAAPIHSPKKKMPKMPRRDTQAQRKQIECARPEKLMMIAPVGAGPQDLDFRERADLMRQECRAERVNMEARDGPIMLHHDRPLNAVPLNNVEQLQNGGEWQCISIAVDSGAAETVIPHNLVKHHPIRDTDASRSGLNYVSATGDPIPNLGEQRLPMCTQEGTFRSMTFQAAPVERALGSVKRMCK